MALPLQSLLAKNIAWQMSNTYDKFVIIQAILKMPSLGFFFLIGGQDMLNTEPALSYTLARKYEIKLTCLSSIGRTAGRKKRRKISEHSLNNFVKLKKMRKKQHCSNKVISKLLRMRVGQRV